MIYNHLFFHAHSLALKSKENKDMPYFMSLSIVNLCFMFNVFSLFFLLEAFEIVPFIFKKEYKWFFPFLFLSIVLGYYMYKGKYNKIYTNWLSKYGKPKKWTSIFIVLMYYIFSFLLALITAMYKNGDGIFG